MFILSKILSSGSNVPEPVKLPPAPDMSFKYGSALVVREGMVFNAMADEMPAYICGENVSGTTPKSITCYPITSDMIFETTLKGDPANIYVGDKVKLSVELGSATGVSDVTTDGFITIFNLNGAKKSGDKIYVRFN